MDELIAQFLEAHVEHELKSFENSGYEKIIQDEVSAIFKWSKNVKLKDIITPEQIISLIHRNVVETPVPGGITELIGEMSRKVLESVHNKNTLLEDIFQRKQFDYILEKGVSLENARIYLIKKLLNSSAYSQLISNLLYIGIKEYLVTENIITRKMPGVSSMIKIGKETFKIAEKLPGVSSLIKAGKKSANYIIPPLEADFENRVKTYIKSNIDNKIQLSEKILTEVLNEKHILATGDKIWESISQTSLSEYFGTIDVNDMDDFVIIGYDFWLHFRQTQYFEAIYKELIYYFFDKYGDNELDVIIEDVGVSEDIIINEIIKLVSPGIETALDTGYLETRIRARLEAFYLSEKAASLSSNFKQCQTFAK